jgi:4-oxalocrotonate tautomerase
MPLVRIDFAVGKAPEYGKQIGLVVYQAMAETLNVPEHDLFEIITEHPQSGLQFDREYLGIHRSDDCVFIQITLNGGRTVEMKQRFYKAVADGLHAKVQLRRETPGRVPHVRRRLTWAEKDGAKPHRTFSAS